MTRKPVIPLTLVIPAFGRHVELAAALASIADQDVWPEKVIVVDDASPEPIRREALNAVAGPPVEIIRHETNLGPAGARNTGIVAAETEWISFLDSDDFLLPQSLAARWQDVAHGTDREGAGERTIFGCGWIEFRDDARPVALRFPRPGRTVADFASGCWFAPGSCVILNRRAVMAAGLQDPAIRRFEDFDWFLDLALQGFSFRPARIAGVAIRRHRTTVYPAREIAQRIVAKRQGALPAILLRRIRAYLALEIAASAYHSGKFETAAVELARSWLLMPRIGLHFSPGWDVRKPPVGLTPPFWRPYPDLQYPKASMLVLIVCNDSAYFMRHRRPVADELTKLGVDVSVIAGGDPAPAAGDHGWSFRHLDIERFHFSPIRDLRLAWTSFFQFARRKPAAVHLITLKPAVFSGVAAVAARTVTRRRMPVVITIPGLGRFMKPGSAMSGVRHRLGRGLVKRAIRWLSRRRDVHFVFETRADRDLWLAEHIVRPESSEQIAGAGVDESIFHPAPERPFSPPGRAHPLRVLFASRLLRSKGLDAFLDAARSFQQDDRVEFLVAGMVEDHDPDRVAPAELERDRSITFLGSATDMPALLRSVDLVCLPSRYGEGIPRILIEAAACGLPGIASDLDGCRQIVVDGTTGHIVPSEPRAAAREMVSAIRRYLDQPRLLEMQGASAREHFLQGGFSQREVVERYIELLGLAR